MDDLTLLWLGIRVCLLLLTIGAGIWLLLLLLRGLVRLFRRKSPTAAAASLDEFTAAVRLTGQLRQANLIDQATYDRWMAAAYATIGRAPTQWGSQPLPLAVIVDEPLPATPGVAPDPSAARDSLDAARAAPPAAPQARSLGQLFGQAKHAAATAGPAPATASVAAPASPASPADTIDAVTGQAPPPSPPRQPLSRMLSAFMESRNIRWGELVGGMLILACSLALVISLWAQIAAIPVLKFFIFTAVTAALFGAGFYTRRRWRLPTTSRGVLITATMLVPLNFLAIAAFSEGAVVATPASIAGEVIAAAVFLALVHLAGRVILPARAGLLTLAVLGPSLWQLLVRRLAGPDASPGLLLALAALPLACYALAVGLAVARAARWPSLSRPKAELLLTLLGIASFATLLPLGLIVFRAADLAASLRLLSPLLAGYALVPLACGLLLWQRVRRIDLGAVRTAGTAVAVAACIALAAALALAWPQPARLLSIALLDAVALAVVGFRFGIRPAHAAAAAALAGSFLLAALMTMGQLTLLSADAPAVARVLAGPLAGPLLVGAVLLLSGVAAAAARLGRRVDAAWWLASAGGVAAISLAQTAWHGLFRADDHGAAVVFSLYAAAALLLTAWERIGLSRRPAAVAGAIALAAMAVIQAVAYRLAAPLGLTDPQVAWLAAMLTVSTLVGAAGAASRRLAGAAATGFTKPLLIANALAASAAAFLLVMIVSPSSAGRDAAYACWLAAAALLMVQVGGGPLAMVCAQLASVLAAAMAAIATVNSQPWFAAADDRLWHPIALSRIGTAVAAVAVGWSLLRLLARRPGLDRFAEGPLFATLRTSPVKADRAAAWAALLALAGLAVFAVIPGLREEFATSAVRSERIFDGRWMLFKHVIGQAGWTLLAVTLAAFVVPLWEGVRKRLVVGITLTFCCAAPVLAARWTGFSATAAALRWALVIAWLAGSLPMLLPSASRWLADRLRWRDLDRSARLATAGRVSLLAATVPAIVLLTLLRVALALAGQNLVGAGRATVFSQMGAAASYGLPLLMVAIGLIGHALRLRSGGYAMAGGLTLNLMITLARLLVLSTAGRAIDAAVAVELLQLNAVLAAGYALLWLAVRDWWLVHAARPARRTSAWATAHAAIGPAIVIALTLPGAMRLFASPADAGPAIARLASPAGWIALALSVGAIIWVLRLHLRRVLAPLTAATAMTAAATVGFAFVGGGNVWRPLQAMLIGLSAAAWLAFACDAGLATILARRRREEAPAGPADGSVLWLLLALMAAVAVSLRIAGQNAACTWTAVAGLAAMGVLAGAAAWRRGSTTLVYLSAILACAAATVWWQFARPAGWGQSPWSDLINLNVLALLIPATFSLWMSRRGRDDERVAPLHCAAANLAPLATVLTSGALWLLVSPLWMGGGWLLDHWEGTLRPAADPPSLLLDWLAVAAAAALVVLRLGERRPGAVVRQAWLTGFAAAALLAAQSGRPFAFAPATLAALAMLLALAWRGRDRLTAAARQLGGRATDPRAGLTIHWTVAVTALAAATIAMQLVLAASPAALDVSPATALFVRLLAGAAVAAGATACAIVGHRGAAAMRQLSLCLTMAAAIALAWAMATPAGPHATLLNRLAAMLAASLVVLAAFSHGLPRRLAGDSPWRASLDRAVVGLAIVPAVGLLVALSVETRDLLAGRASAIGGAGIALILAVLLGLIAIAMSFALSPRRDPLKLSDRGRTVYVYAAELLMVLAFLHVRASMPWLFHGFFQAYWPIIVMAIAFAGVGLSELFARQGRRVLAEPLERTGILLPLLPVLGFWALNSKVHFSVELLLVGLLYGLLSVRRKSFGFGLLAALSANGGLWYYLHRQPGLGLINHPQLWLIPLALAVLAAGRLNRDRLSEPQRTALRYGCLMLIYLSSTVEIFLNGVASSPWLPMILAALSVAGVLVGIWQRLRSFLFLGASFLVLSLVTMIWHAAENFGWTWLWYVAGIALGAMIIALFALFEKKRVEMLDMVNQLKRWKA